MSYPFYPPLPNNDPNPHSYPPTQWNVQRTSSQQPVPATAQAWSNQQPNSAQTQQDHQVPQTQQTQMMAMMTMWQQMQQQASLMPQFASHPTQPAQAAASDPLTPHAQYDQDLAQVLYESKYKGMSYKTAIETLHFHRGIHADTWKNYFLAHYHRIDKIVTALHARTNQSAHVNGSVHHNDSVSSSRKPLQPQSSTAETIRPSRESTANVKVKQEFSNGDIKRAMSSSASTSRATVAVAAPKRSLTDPHKDLSKTVHAEPVVAPVLGRRKTLNSLCAPPMNLIPSTVPISETTGLPLAPSRSPTPPPADVFRKSRGGGTQYIPEDEAYFFRFITWKLSKDPALKKIELCEMLGDQVPAHSAQSWLAFWRKNDDVADKILFNAQLDEDDEHAVLPTVASRGQKQGEHTSKPPIAHRSRVKYEAAVDSDVDAEGEDDDEEDQSTSESSAHSDDDYDEAGSDGLDSSDDGGDVMGEAGSAFGMAEMRALAKHIASLPDWKERKSSERWEDFARRYPKRTHASWKEYYRRRERDVDALARRYSKRATRRGSVKTQRRRPSWASNGQSHKSAKRGHSCEQDSDRDGKKSRTAEN